MGRQADQIGARLETLLGGVAKALTLEVTANLTADCPVDTNHARRNFVPSIGQPHDGEDEGQAQQQGQVAVLSYRIGQGDLYVTNNVDYLQYLILGSSSQQPAGWDLAAVDRATETIRQQYDVSIDVTSSSDIASRGARAAEGLAAAFSPFGDE